MNRPNKSRSPQQPPPIVIRDNRSIGPVTLQPRKPDQAAAERETGRGEKSAVLGAERGPAQGGQAAELEVQLAERTADLQRLKAEYDNYRKRMQRDRLAIREIDRRPGTCGPAGPPAPPRC